MCQDPNGENGLLWFKLGKLLQAIGNEKDEAMMKDAFKKAHEIHPENVRFKTHFDKLTSLDRSTSSSLLTSPIHQTQHKTSVSQHASPNKVKSSDMMKALDNAAAASSSPKLHTTTTSSVGASGSLDEDEALEMSALEFVQRIQIETYVSKQDLGAHTEGVCLVDMLKLNSVQGGPCNQQALKTKKDSPQPHRMTSSQRVAEEEESTIDMSWKKELYTCAGMNDDYSYHTKVVASLQQLTDAKHMIYSNKKQSKEVLILY